MLLSQIISLTFWVAFAAAFLPVAAARGGGQADCSYDGLGTATLTVHEGRAAISRNADQITWSGSGSGGRRPCGRATVHNTDRIRLVDDAEKYDRALGVDLSRGHMAPGKTHEDAGRSEIEIVAHFAGGHESQMYVIGTTRSDRVIVGTRGAKLNRDRDVDAFVTDPGFYYVEGGRGNDFLSFEGGERTGDAWGPTEFFENELSGGRGRDTLVGGPGVNSLAGGLGPDLLRGKGGDDFADGGSGDDRAFGSGGADGLVGRGGNDHLEGGRANDALEGGDGTDRLDGDEGRDSCSGGRGRDRLEDCEP